MPKKLKKKCCKSYREKGKACKNCPLMARLQPEDQETVLSAYKKSKKKKKARKKARKEAKKLLAQALDS